MSRVLIIDDAAFMRKILRNILERNSFEIIGEVDNGNAALAKIKELEPDIISLDITMPGKDGLAILKDIQARNIAAKVIMVTAMGQESVVREAALYGAKGFVLKPFKEELVLKVFAGV